MVAAVALRFADLPAARATGESLSLHGRDTLGIGLQDVYRLSLSDAAPPGGVAVTLDSNDDTCVLASTENATGDGSPIVVTIPYRQRKAAFVIQSVESPVDTTCDVTATAVDWTPDALAVTMAEPALRIRDFRGRYAPLASNDPFFVEVGVPRASGGLLYVQGASKQLAADPMVTVCSANTDVGTIVDVFGDDSGNDGCESAPIYAPFTRTVPGNLQFDPDDPSDPNDVTTVVTATSTGFAAPDERNATVGDLTVSIHGAEELGANLQDEYTLRLSAAASSAVEATITVADSDVCVVAETPHSLGHAMITRTVPANRYRATFVVQGIEAGEVCEVTVSAGGFGSTEMLIDVKATAARLRQVPSQIAEFADNAPFFVEIGVPNPTGSGLRHVQPLRKGTDPTPNLPLDITVSSTPKETGTIVDVTGDDNGDDGEETASILPGYSRTVPGHLQFDPVDGDPVPAFVEIELPPGFEANTASSKEVLVTGASLRISGSDELGSFLQDDYKVRLVDAGGHPATVVTVTSLSPGICDVAATPNSTGSASINLNVAAGQGQVDFVVQAAEHISDVECHIEASAPIFNDAATYTIDIVQGAIEIRALRRNINEEAGNDPFFVQVGLPSSDCNRVRRTQTVRKGSTVSFQVCSDNIDVGTIVDVINVDNGADGCEDGVIFATFSNSVPGDVKFDPNEPGSTLVTVTAPGFKTAEHSGNVEVHVGGDSLHLSLPSRLGSNLQAKASLRLSRGADPAGTDVLIESLTPDRCRVAADAMTAGTDDITVTIPADARGIDFVVSALEGLDDETCLVRATATGFRGDEDETRIVAPAVQITGLRRGIGTTSPDQEFLVEIGVPGSGGIGPAQAVRWGGPAEEVKVCSENPDVAEIVGAGVDGCLIVSIPEGESSATYFLHVTGTPGSSNVTASGGVDATDTVRVTVAATVVNATGPDLLGKDLQALYHARVNNGGGVSITVSAAPATVCVVSESISVQGDGSPIALVVPPGSQRVPFTVQAIDVGSCTISVSGTNIPMTAIDVSVVYSRLRIRGLDSEMTIRDPGDQFRVEIGPANPAVADVLTRRDNRYGITRPMARRVGAGALVVRVCSDTTVAEVHDPSHLAPPASPCVEDSIAEGDSETQRFELHPVDDGTTPVTAESPAEPDVDDTQLDVTIKQAGLAIRGGHDEVGKDLQEEWRAVFDHVPPAGTQVTVTVVDGSGDCAVATNNTDPSDADDVLTLPVTTGRDSVEFWVRGVALGDCTITVESDAPASGTASRTIEIVTPAVQIGGLQRTQSVLDPPDPFGVEIGIANGSERRLRATQILVPGAQIPFKVCSSDDNVGDILGGTADSNCAKTTFGEGEDVNEELSFRPLNAGDTDVSVEYDGVDLIFTDRATVPVKVRAEALQIRPDDRLGAQLQDEYRVVISKSLAIDSVVTLTVPALATDTCLVSASEAGPFAAAAVVAIPANEGRASFWVYGVAPGECLIDPTINQAGFEPSQASIDIVDPTLRIRDLASSMSTQSGNDPFFVQVGAIGRRGEHMAEAQNAAAGNGGIAVKVCSSNPDVGELVGDDVDGCVVVVVPELSDRTDAGALIFHPRGEDPSSDTTVICASAAGFTPIARSCRTVRVVAVTPKVVGPDLGAGLQEQYTLRLTHSLSAAQSINVRVATESLGICDVAVGAADDGVDEIDVIVPANRSREQFHVLAEEGAMGTCRLLIDAPVGSGILDGFDEIEVVAPGLKIVGLDRSQASNGQNDEFKVVVGVPGGNLRNLRHEQAARNDGDGVTVEVCSSRALVGKIVGADPLTDCRDGVIVAAGESRSPQDGLFFDPVGSDTTTDQTVVTASSAGFIPTALAERPVRVVTVGVNISGVDLGADLQDVYFLNVTKAVTVESEFTISVDPASAALCTVALGELDAGDDSIDVIVPAGRARARFYVHAFEDVTGLCILHIDSPAGIADGSGDIDIVPPALRIINLDSSHSTQAKDDPFNAESGIPSANLRNLAHVQAARADGDGIPVEVCSSVPGVGTIGGLACRTVDIPPGKSRTPDGALLFDPVAPELTTVTATSPGFISTDRASRDIRVSATVANVNGPDLGAGLMDVYALALSKSLASAATFDIQVGDASVCRVALNSIAASQPQIQVSIGATKSRASFYIHGVGVGTCELNITPSAGSGVVVGVNEVAVVEGGLRISDLAPSQSPEGKNDPFRVDVGVPGRGLEGLAYLQRARSDVAGGISVEVCSSRPLVGKPVGAPDVPGCIVVTIPQGADHTGPMALFFDPRGEDPNEITTTVTATNDDLISTDKASRDVRVASLVVNVNGPDLGVGLQQSYVLALSGAVASNTTFTVAVLDAANCLVAPNNASAGLPSIPVTVPANKSQADFWVQALSDGTCGVTVTPPAGVGVAPGLREIELVFPGLRIVNLDSSRSSTSQNDPFNVDIGLPGGQLRTLDRRQEVRHGNTVTFDVCSTQPLVGAIVDANPSTGCKSVSITAGKSQTAEGALVFDALGNNPYTSLTVVHAGTYAPDLTQLDAASREVRVAATVTTANGPDDVGAGLQEIYSITISNAAVNDHLMTITSTTTDKCLVSNAEGATAAWYTTATIPKGRSRADFFVHGIAPGTCSLTLTPPVWIGITAGERTLSIVEPALRIIDLVSSIRTGAPDDKFRIKLGVPTDNLRDIKREQKVRAGTSVVVRVCTTNVYWATVIGTGTGDPECVTSTVAALQSKTPDGATSLALHAEGLGTVQIEASASDYGFIQTENAIEDVRVSTGSLNVDGGKEAIGAGLQDTFSLLINPKTPSVGLPITITSETPTVCVVSLSESTVGSAIQPIHVGKGRSLQKFTVQGLTQGDCELTITTTNTNYSPGSLEIPIVQPALRLRDVDPTTTGNSADDPFFIDVGVAKDDLKALKYLQTVRPGTGGLTVMACSSNTVAAEVLGTAVVGRPECKSANIPTAASGTAKNALKLHPAYVGSSQASTTVTAEAPGHLTTIDQGSVDVVVAGSALSFIEGNIDRVGSGLMDIFKVQTNGTVGNDTSVTVESLTPGVCRVAVDENTVSQVSVPVVIKAGNKTKTFAIHGLENVTGACNLRATHASYVTGFATYDIVQAGLRLYDLRSNRPAGAPDDSFKVHVGLPKAGLENLQTTQKVRTGSAGLSLTVCSGDVNVGKIVVGSSALECQTVVMAAGMYRTVDNAMKFRPVGNGTTVVEVTATNHITTDAGAKEVSVDGYGLTIENGGTDKIGAGLQKNSFTVVRTGTNSGTVGVQVRSLTTSRCVVSTSGTAAGTETTSVTINGGAWSSNAFYVQGIENAQGSCELEATLSNYTTGVGQVDIVHAAVRLVPNSLAGTIAYSAPNDLFNIEVGVSDDALATLTAVQPVRGGSTGLYLTVSNGNDQVGTLVGSSSSGVTITAQSITVRIPANASTNNGTGYEQKLEFDANNALENTAGTSVSVSSPDVISTGAATQTVTVLGSSGGC